MTTIGSLFTGAGALCELAVAPLLGGRVSWHCENDPAASRVLAHRFPGTPNLGDITAVDWESVEPVDVVVGGFPCQDISSAGRRAGMEGARSGLWSFYGDAIRVLRPRLVLIENVAALIVRGLDRVLADLAALGLDAEWTSIRASGVDAPHRRERVFIAAADTAGPRWGPLEPQHVGVYGRSTVPAGQAESGRRDRAPADSCGIEVREQPVHEPWGGGTPLPGLDHPVDGDDWGIYAAAITRWERELDRRAPAPVIVGKRGGRQLNPVFVEWMMGLPGGHVTAVPGLSRNEMLRLLGNGVVPQQAWAAYRWLLPFLVAPLFTDEEATPA